MTRPLADKVAMLRGAFVAQVTDRLADAERLLRLLDGGLADDRPVSELKRLLHNLKGSSGTFGLADLQAAAQAAEEQLARLLPGRVAGDGRLAGEMAAPLAAMERLVASLSNDPKPTSFQVSAGPAMGMGPAKDRAGRGKRVYLCDDDPVLAEQLQQQIACFGYEVLVFESPAALREALPAGLPDALIMDAVFAEGVDAGFELVEELRRAGLSVPTLFISCRDDFEARLQAVQAGGLAYFAKPVRALDLVERLDELTSDVQPEPYRVLVVDDEPEVAAYHALILEAAGMLVQAVTEPVRVLQVLRDFRADLVLMDLYMPNCSGRDLAQVIRQIPDFVSLPIVYLSIETDEGKQSSALRLGADGFLSKPIEPDQLVSTVCLRAERMRVLRSLMVRDSLTGLLNHTATAQFLDNTVATARRRNSSVCFAMIDIDHFKQVNDTYGHPVGDQVLCALASVLRQQLRGSDVVGRYGGEEFAVVLSDVSLDQAMRILEELRVYFGDLLFLADDREFSVTFSCGVAAFPAYDRPETLCRAADSALYEAKSAGRNRILAAR